MPRLELQKEYAHEKRLTAVAKVLIKLTLRNAKREKIKNRKKLAVSRGYIPVIFVSIDLNFVSVIKSAEKPPKLLEFAFLGCY